MDFDAYLDALASAAPTPGGGSAATLVGALGAALCAMVARITLASDKHRDVHAPAAMVAGDADNLRRLFLELRPLDEDAFRAVVDAQAMPRDTEARRADRTVHLQGALIGAATVPLEAARLARELLDLTARTAELRNVHVMSDVDCAMRFARAAFDASTANVAVNHHYMKDARLIAEQRTRLAALTLGALEAETRAAAVVTSSSPR